MPTVPGSPEYQIRQHRSPIALELTNDKLGGRGDVGRFKRTSGRHATTTKSSPSGYTSSNETGARNGGVGPP